MGSNSLTWTKEQKNTYYREYNKKPEQKEKNRIRNKKYRKENPERYLLWKAKERSKRFGLEFNLEIEDIKIPEVCPILGIPLKQSENVVKSPSPSLDRIDNSKGYVKGNVCVISQRANQLKSNMTIEQITKLLKYIKQS